MQSLEKEQSDQVRFFPTQENLIRIISGIYNYDLDTARQFMVDLLKETFFFGSAVVLALVSTDEPAFRVGDLDIICVLSKSFKPPVLWTRKGRAQFRNGKLLKIDPDYQPLNDMCDCLGRERSGIFIKQHAAHHATLKDIMMMPGETCSTVKSELFQNVRRWFGPMKMIVRKMYNPTLGHFCAASRNICVASPGFDRDTDKERWGDDFRDDEEERERRESIKKTTDMIFLHNTEKDSDMHFAWKHVKKTPFFPGVNLVGMENGKLKLKIGNFEMLQTRTCVVPSRSEICHSPTGQLSDKMFQYLVKYVRNDVCDLAFEFELDDIPSVQNMGFVMHKSINMKTKRLPEKDGVATFTILRSKTSTKTWKNEKDLPK